MGSIILAYADDVNIVGENTETMKKNALLDSSKDVGLGPPLTRLLDDMTAETETGHPGLNS
jgi:hypothetical protein